MTTKQKLYALAIGCVKRDVVQPIMQYVGAACLAVSGEEAIGKGINLAKEKWPYKDNWGEHWCSYCLVPSSMIKAVI